MIGSPFEIIQQPGPIIATAIHAGHELRPEVAPLLAVTQRNRRREEDPHTDCWTVVGDSRIVGRRSRFEVDLNRPKERAIYSGPEEAWGLQVWREELSPEQRGRSLAIYDDFYRSLTGLVEQEIATHGRVVLLDFHAYNHRRAGPDAEPAPSEQNPDVNVGTSNMRREQWDSVLDTFISQMRGCRIGERALDVRENVKFKGGQMSRWLHARYPKQVCSISVEVKKIFVDEWTGELNQRVATALEESLQEAVGKIRQVLAGL